MSDPAFRRAILIRTEEERITARLEDDFHRFGLLILHDGRTVTGLHGEAGRFPWATCAEAPRVLSPLEGAAVGGHPARLFLQADARRQCTHLFELAALALSAARAGPGRRLFEAEVTDPQGDHRTARLYADNESVLEWRLAGDDIEGPEPFAGRTVAAFTSKTLLALPQDEAERLLILRRVVQTARGRQMDVDAFADAAAMGRPPQCFSLQPGVAERAKRMRGSVKTWPDLPSLLRAVEN